MTSTPARGVDRVHGASGRPPRTLDRIPALALILLAGFVLRLTIAHILFPGSGFASDIGSFKGWATTLVEHGPGGFYAASSFADYPPGYMYVLWIVGMLADALKQFGGENEFTLLIKLPPMLADIGVAFLIHRLVSGWSSVPGRNAPRLALIAAAFYLFNPVTIYDSALWGQTDAVGALVMLAGVALLIKGHPEGAIAAAVLAGLVKPQFGVVLAPLVVAVLIRRHLLARGSGPRGRPSFVPAGLAAWMESEQGPIRLVTSAVVGVVFLFALITPFALDLRGFVELMARTAGGYPYLSVNAYNPWAMVGADGTPSLAASGAWSADTVPFLGPIPGVLVGGFLLAAGFVVGLARILWRADRWSILVVATFLGLCFFVLPTRAHERYLFPVFAFLPILAVASRQWRWALVLLAIGSFMNLHGVLTDDNPVYGTPNVASLPLGDLFRSYLGVLVSVALHVGVFAFVAWQLRPGAVRHPDPLARAVMSGGRLASDVPDASTPGAVDGASGQPGAPVPGGALATTTASSPWSDDRSGSMPWDGPPPGVLTWILAKVRVSPLRRDRSGELDREPGGRFDRLDLLMLVVVVVSAMSLRAYRLHEPYDMHFDEVYHARTATEFLQDWRYDEPHGIYEYTHPHFAKYAMALGLVAFGNDTVTATSELGVSVRDAAVERRWSPSSASTQRDGDRLYVATGEDLRVYDLSTRDLVAALAIPAVAVAVDEDSHRLVAGGAGGDIWTLDTGGLDDLRRTPGAAVPTPTVLVSLGPAASIDGLTAVDDAILVRSPDRVERIDALTAASTGEATVPGVSAVVPVPEGDQIVVDPDAVEDVTTLSAALADLLGEDEERIATLIEDASGPVAIAAYLDEDTLTNIQDGIADGTLAGVTTERRPALAIAGETGVHLVDSVTLAEYDAADTRGWVTGMTLVEGLDDPTLYVSVGARLMWLPVRDDGLAGPTTLEMPGTITTLAWNGPSNLVHALGEAPDGSSQTVYVIEPHANAVFADARLAFDPAAIVIDNQPQRPTDDRQDLLALSPTGSVASVDIGSHALAWRLPGVIMGALMAGAVYLLARVLFRRRSVAVIAAVLILVEGMAFANSRIAMNDTYVATFIVIAAALFAPIYLGIWRRWWVVALTLPLVGLALGLALSSKWVGAYAVGFIVLLVLLRSALGRVIALIGMLGLTGVLGYLGLRSDPATVDPHLNYTFLIMMVGLTALLAAAMVRRPVRATLEELRFAVVAPAALGAVLVLAGIVLGQGPASTDSFLTPSRILAAGAGMLFLAAVAYGGSWLLARWGIGPLAPLRPVDADTPVPSPAPTGWLRPGWAGGVPWIYAIACLTAIPIAIYVVSYLPWVALGNRLTDSWPPGNHGQTLWDLTMSMYNYHNNLRAGHAASSPWWAWPLDLKPVWFYQDGFADNMTGVIYDTGNLVIFWLAIPAVLFAAWQAWVRRSLALTLVVLGVVVLWVPWVRIDRATFQYHVFTSLPFAVIALAYFLAELWHGASERTFLLARVAGALAILGPPLLWLLRVPLCTAAGTDIAHPNGIACGEITRSLTIADNVLVSALVALAAVGVIGWMMVLAMRGRGRAAVSPLASILVVTALAAAGVAAAQIFFSGQPALTIQLRAEEIVLAVLVLLAGPAWLALRARDARRWVVGAIGAAAMFFVIWYPNLSGLPMPNSIAPAYLGLLPTWNYDFQFAVNLDPPATGPIRWVEIAAITAGTAVLVLGVMLAARSWRARRTALTGGAVSDTARAR